MRNFVLLITATLFFQNLKAQNWCPKGATWYTSVWSDLLGYDAVVEYKYTKDTVIQNTNCKMIKGTFKGVSMPDYATLNYTVVPNYRTYYTFENNKVIYLSSGAGFDTVVNFNATIGDKWSSWLYCGDADAFAVCDTGHVVINGKRFHTVTAGNTFTYTVGGFLHTDTNKIVFIERVLNFDVNWKTMFGKTCPDTSGIEYETPWWSYCGYSDDTFSIYYGGSGCKTTGVRNVFAAEMNLQLFPNPNNGLFTLETNSEGHLCVCNTLGVTVFETLITKPGKMEINVQELPPGVYQVKTQSSSGYLCQKFVKN